MKNLFFAFLMLFSLSAFSQEVLSNFSVSYETGTFSTTEQLTQHQIDSIVANLPQKFIFILSIQNPAAVKAALTLNLNNSTEATFNDVINLDGTNLPAGVALERFGNDVKVILSNLHGIKQFYATCKLTLANGDSSRTYSAYN